MFSQPVERWAGLVRPLITLYDPPPEGQDITKGTRVQIGKEHEWLGWARLKQPSYYAQNDKLLRHEATADWQKVDVRLMALAGRVLRYFDQLEVPLWVHGAFRTREEQAAFVRSGNSQVQWPEASHCQGMALDFVHARYGWDLHKPEWYMIGRVVKQCWRDLQVEYPPGQRVALTWGGDWLSAAARRRGEVVGPQNIGWDPAHYEIQDWRTRLKPISVLEPGEPLRMTRQNLHGVAMGDAPKVTMGRGKWVWVPEAS